MVRPMSNEALRWRSYRNNTITKRYIIHYLIYLEHHANNTKTDFDALEDELLNILLAMDEACRAKRWQRVQRFGRILCAIDGFLHVRGYGSELVNRLDQVINATKAEKNP